MDTVRPNDAVIEAWAIAQVSDLRQQAEEVSEGEPEDVWYALQCVLDGVEREVRKALSNRQR